MNPLLEATLAERVSASKAGRAVSSGAVLSAVRWALQRHKPADAEKAAKARLHQLFGAWAEEGWVRRAGKLLNALERGELDSAGAARALMALHASTRERLEAVGECYARIFAACGTKGSVLDVACGLNPLAFALPGMPRPVLLAVDASLPAVDTLNRFFALTGWKDARAQARDALDLGPCGPTDLALVMKFLPLAERVEKGSAARLLNSIDARHIAVSFPTRSLSGRDVGMERNYSKWFEELEIDSEIIERFVCGEEVFYILTKQVSLPLDQTKGDAK